MRGVGSWLQRFAVTVHGGEGQRRRRSALARPPVRRVWRAVLTSAVLLGPLVVEYTPTAASPRQAHHTVSYGVGVTRCTFVDPTRGVLNYATRPPSPLSSVRTLVTEIRYPTLQPSAGLVETPGAVPASVAGGLPMIVFAHGYDVMPDTYAPLLDAWVRAGFVVAAPIFPDENRLAVARQYPANTENDIWNEPADLAFVASQLVIASAVVTANCRAVHGLINANELALAGHSDGATAVAMLAFARGLDRQGVTYQSLRVPLDFRAAAVMSGQEDGVDPYTPLPPDPALLVIQSARDQCNRASNAVKLYRDLHQSNKWFLELLTAHHLPPFDGVDQSAFGVVAQTSTRFFQIALAGAYPRSTLVTLGAQDPAVARMVYDGRGPTIAPPSVPTGPCGPN